MADASRFDVPYKLLQREAGDAGTTVPLQLSADMAGPAASVSTDDVNALCWAGGACLPRRARPPGFVTCRWRRPRSGRHPEGEVALAVQDELLLVPEGAQLDGHGLHRPVAAVRAAAVRWRRTHSRCGVVPTSGHPPGQGMWGGGIWGGQHIDAGRPALPNPLHYDMGPPPHSRLRHPGCQHPLQCRCWPLGRPMLLSRRAA